MLSSTLFTHLASSQELYVQCAPNENGVGLQNNWSSSGDDIVYPSICSNSRNFPAHQTDINAGMHSTLVDWLVDECGSYGVQASTWCLCVHIMDEYLRRVADVPTYRFQLLGCACLLLAAKLEQATVRYYRPIYFICSQLLY